MFTVYGNWYKKTQEILLNSNQNLPSPHLGTIIPAPLQKIVRQYAPLQISLNFTTLARIDIKLVAYACSRSSNYGGLEFESRSYSYFCQVTDWSKLLSIQAANDRLQIYQCVIRVYIIRLFMCKNYDYVKTVYLYSAI